MTEEILIKSEPPDLYDEESDIQNNHDDPSDQLLISRILQENDDKKRRSITLQQKMDIIKRYENNERTRDIMRDTGINESTLRSIRNNADKIKSSCMTGANLSKSASKTSRTRPKLLEETERLLGIWVEQQLSKPCQTHKKLPFKITLTEKALLIYNELKRNAKNPNDIIPFTASNSWYKGFKKRYNLSNYRMLGDAFGTSIFHKQRIMSAPTVASLQRTLALPGGVKELGELGKVANGELIVQPIFDNKDNGNGSNVTQNSDSETSDMEFCENTLADDSPSLNEMSKRRTSLTLQEQLYISQLFERCEREDHIGLNVVHASVPTHGTALLNKEKLSQQMEEILKMWIDQELCEETDLSLSMVQRKANAIYTDLVKMCSDTRGIEPFTADYTWLYHFKSRNNLDEVRDDLRPEHIKPPLMDDGESSEEDDKFKHYYPETVLEESVSSNSSHVATFQVNSAKTQPRPFNYGLNVTALMNMKNNAKKVQPRPNILQETERLLSAWMDQERRAHCGPGLTVIQQHALSIYEDLKKTYDPVDVLPFKASFSWLVDFKNRHKAKTASEFGDFTDRDPVSAALARIQAALDILEAHDSNVERRESVVRGVKRVLAPYYQLSEKSDLKRQKLL